MKFSELTFRAHFGRLWPPNSSSESSPTVKSHRPWIVLGDGERKLACLFFASDSFLHPKFVDLGLGHFWGFPTSGGATPDLTDGHYSPWDIEKKQFLFRGNRPPFGGDMGISNFAILAFFDILTAIFSKTGRQIFTKFLQSTDRLAWCII